ncbi:hypothetical protein PoMZ_05640 [Pyricularia oryzae]|uniref:Uncharacterized protein n=1 Tax=Pyricularia oryzae TaxID=318829 RepID=A0A4P7NP12_PYROR|nr:hypothetical protein PoMZ_05640 [Pyricularia oryzae]
MHQARCKRCVAAQKYRPTFICGQVALDALHTRRYLPFPSLPHINHSPPFLHLPIQDSVLRRNRGAAFEWILGIPDQRKGCRREKSKRSRGKTMIPAPGHLRYRLLSNGRRRYGAWFSGAEAPGNTRRREFERRGNA